MIEKAKGKKIESPDDVMLAASERRSLTGDGYVFERNDPIPAAFLVNMSYPQLVRAIKSGMWIYEKSKYGTCPCCGK